MIPKPAVDRQTGHRRVDSQSAPLEQQKCEKLGTSNFDDTKISFPSEIARLTEHFSENGNNEFESKFMVVNQIVCR